MILERKRYHPAVKIKKIERLVWTFKNWGNLHNLVEIYRKNDFDLRRLSLVPINNGNRGFGVI